MAKKKDNKGDKPGFFDKVGSFFVGLGKKIKETFSELKKVTWPSFPKVLKATGVVLVVVIAFTVVVTGINYGLQALLKVITDIPGLGGKSESFIELTKYLL